MERPVRIRETLSVAAAVLSMGTVFFLMYKELSDEDGDGRFDKIAPTEAQATSTAGQQDPLLGIDYVSTNRQDNLTAFGLDEEMVSITMRRIKKLDTRPNRKRLKGLLEATSADQAFLQMALCGATNDQRPRYGAMQLLVKSKGGELFVMGIDDLGTSNLSSQDWSSTSAWSEVYRDVELIGERRQEDATLMGIAAILLGREDAVIDEIYPWGSQGSDEWSWEEVAKSPGIERELTKYFALFHLVAEVAFEDGGICQD